MQENEINTTDVAEQTFQFLVRSLFWRNEYVKCHFRNRKKDNLLSDKKFFILFLIDGGHAKSVSELEELFKNSGSSISILVSKLSHEGYINKIYPKKGEDGRKVIFEITEEGKNILKDTKIKIIEGIGDFYLELNESQKKYFRTGVENLNKVMEKNV